MDNVKVGGELDAYCMTCKDMKWHVVVAVVDEKPAKVECNGCHKQHLYRTGPPGAPRPRAPRKPRHDGPAAPTPINDLEARLVAGEGDARTYSPSDVYAVDQFVRHPTFGVGLVAALQSQKVEIAFRSGRKLLVHRRGDATAAPMLTRPSRADEDAPRGVTDAPLKSR